jgi:hypothetical protein
MAAAPCDGAIPSTPAPNFCGANIAAFLDRVPPLARGATDRLTPAPAEHLAEVVLARPDKPPERSAAA